MRQRAFRVDQGMLFANFACMKNYLSLATLVVALASGSAALAQGAQTNPPPDNTKVNKQGGLTADDQSQDKADLELLANIRSAVTKDKTLSIDAHNCKIITNNRKVTLRGPVRTAKEKDTINRIAVKFAGQGNVTNELTIKPAK